MPRLGLACAVLLVALSSAFAQTPATLGDQANELLGSWEFSNADRDRTCTAVFKGDRTAVGFKVEFDRGCAGRFPFIADVAGWTFPDGDLLRLLDAQGKTLAEFSEVEDGLYEAPTPGVGVLFLQNAALAGGQAKSVDQVAGNWTLTRGGVSVCSLTLAATAAKDGFALTVQPGCEASVARQNFAQWRLDRDELVLIPARGNPWRFEEGDDGWRRLPETAERMMLVKQ